MRRPPLCPPFAACHPLRAMSDDDRARPCRRRRWLLAVVAVIVVVRIALPEVIRRVAVSQLRDRLRTRVDIGDVDLALHRGGVALKDVAVYSPTPETPAEPPLVAWKRFAVELRWIPLLSKTIQLRRIELDTPRIALDRLANGELNLRRLVPAAEPAAAPAPEAPPAKPSQWKIGLDRFSLTNGGIRFRDLTLHEGEPLEIAIPDVSVGDVSLAPGLYGEPARARLEVKSEGGAVRVDGRMWPLADGFALAVHAKAHGLPLRRSRLYIPGVGWSEVEGLLDASLDWGLAPAPDEKNAASAVVWVRDVAIRIPDIEESAFALGHLAVRVDPLDLRARRAAVRRVDVAGARVVVDLQKGGDVLPLLRPTPAAAERSAAPPAKEAAPFHWAVGSLRVADSHASLLQEGAPLDVGIALAAHGLADDAERPGRIDATVTIGAGTIALAGAARVKPPGFGGTLRIDALPVHDLVRAGHAAAKLPAGVLQSAVLGTELALEAGLDADGNAAPTADAVRVRGTVGVDDLRVATAEASDFAARWKALRIGIDEIVLPGTLPGAPSDAKARPIRVALGSVTLDEPDVQLTRTADGIVLPALAGEKPPGGDATPAAEPVAADHAPPAPRPDVAVQQLVVRHGRIAVQDRTVKPFFTGEVKPLELDVRGVRSDGPVVERFTLSAATPARGKLAVTGSLRPGGGKIEVNGKDIALAPYNPFVASLSPYSIGARSALTVHTKAAMANGRWDTDTAITLQKLTVKGAAGDTVFKQQFGIPLSMALALLRDLQGNIKLDVPVTVDRSGTSVALGTVVAGALKSALLGAVASPLKMVGAALGGGEHDLEPPPIRMATGRADPTPDGEKQTAQLAELLAGRPGLGLELDAIVTPADLRWLDEQALRAELDARKGVVNAIAGLRERSARLRIQKALAERATGGAGELSDDDKNLLDQWIAERPHAGAEQARALAAARANAVGALLRDRHGVPPNRVTLGDASAQVANEGEPGVRVTFGAPAE
jgi:hypothetical protein